MKASTPQPAGTLAPPNEGSNGAPFRGQSLPRAFPVSPKATSPNPEVNFDRFGQYAKTPERPKFRKQRSITDLLCTTEDAQPPLPPPKEAKWGQKSKNALTVTLKLITLVLSRNIQIPSRFVQSVMKFFVGRDQPKT